MDGRQHWNGGLLGVRSDLPSDDDKKVADSFLYVPTYTKGRFLNGRNIRVNIHSVDDKVRYYMIKDNYYDLEYAENIGFLFFQREPHGALFAFCNRKSAKYIMKKELLRYFNRSIEGGVSSVIEKIVSCGFDNYFQKTLGKLSGVPDHYIIGVLGWRLSSLVYSESKYTVEESLTEVQVESPGSLDAFFDVCAACNKYFHYKCKNCDVKFCSLFCLKSRYFHADTCTLRK